MMERSNGEVGSLHPEGSGHASPVTRFTQQSPAPMSTANGASHSQYQAYNGYDHPLPNDQLRSATPFHSRTQQTEAVLMNHHSTYAPVNDRPPHYHRNSLLRNEFYSVAGRESSVKQENHKLTPSLGHYATRQPINSLLNGPNNQLVFYKSYGATIEQSNIQRSANDASHHRPLSLPSVHELTNSHISLNYPNQPATPVSCERSTGAHQLITPPKLQSPFHSPTKATVKAMAPIRSKRNIPDKTHISLSEIDPNAPLPSIEGLPPRNPSSQSVGGNQYQHQRPSEKDEFYVKHLVQAMVTMDCAEDNSGMKETWSKLLKSRPSRILEICQEILVLLDRASRNDENLCTKKPLYHYPSFEERFKSVCQTLRTQKTVCKHLLEDPYIYQVVDDPCGAMKRVQNNRRVNDQKRVAIEEGRKKIGVKGKGKGLALEPIEPCEDSDSEANLVKSPASNDSARSPPRTTRRSRRQATKRKYKETRDDGDYEEATPPKRAKKHIARQVQTPLPNLNTNLSSGVASAETSYPSSATDYGNNLTPRSPPPPNNTAHQVYTAGLEGAQPVAPIDFPNSSAITISSACLNPVEPTIDHEYGLSDYYRGRSMVSMYDPMFGPMRSQFVGDWYYDSPQENNFSTM